MNHLVPSQSTAVAQNPNQSAQPAVRRPRYSAERHEKGYRVEILLPGVPREAINLTFENDWLHVSGRRDETLKEGQKVLQRETFVGEYRLDLNVEAQIHVEDINATHENGVLKVELPFAPEVQPRQIAIQ
ncbi:MAG: heat shock protein Hsp20 [Puniceicoccaceae bacterium 5H]|nr:MAG: heat shock protein Hsp20 [Puniceicoccaceae bacterium 5H]